MLAPERTSLQLPRPLHLDLRAFLFLLILPPPTSTLFPYTTLFRSSRSPEPRADHRRHGPGRFISSRAAAGEGIRSEEHTSELQSHSDLVCRLLLEKKKNNTSNRHQRES